MNTKLTERQGKILNGIVKEYIDSAQPVSSQLLEKKYDFNISPATIRIEMQKLTDKDFLFQPHTSAGRIPTDWGYRFFVDNLFEEGFSEEKDILKFEDLIEKEMGDTVKFLQSLTKNLAHFSSNLALGYLLDEDIFWKEGWEEVLREPEFKTAGLISNFADVIERFEKDVEDIKINSGIKVFIGKENPFLKTKEFSIILSRCRFPKKTTTHPPHPPVPQKGDGPRGILAIAGPKRMAYDRNISLMNSLIKLLE